MTFICSALISRHLPLLLSRRYRVPPYPPPPPTDRCRGVGGGEGGVTPPRLWKSFVHSAGIIHCKEIKSRWSGRKIFEIMFVQWNAEQYVIRMHLVRISSVSTYIFYFRSCLTSNVLLILKAGGYFFRRQIGHNKSSLHSGQFRDQKGLSPPWKLPRNDPFYVLTKTKKNYITHFSNQRFIGIFMSHTERAILKSKGSRPPHKISQNDL